jgi:putative transposase
MARRARVVIPGCPHHVTHRGNLRAQVFFCEEDRKFYLATLAQCCRKFGVEVWAYCLMTNHIHMIAVPHAEESLGRALGQARQRYSSVVNARHHWTGNLWANRFHSSPMDEEHLWFGVRYVELNPVRAGIVERATDYSWSSASAHAGTAVAHELLSEARPFPGHHTRWEEFLNAGTSAAQAEQLRINTSTGRPTGSLQFVKTLEEQTGRVLRALRPGPKAQTIPDAGLIDDLFA